MTAAKVKAGKSAEQEKEERQRAPKTAAGGEMEKEKVPDWAENMEHTLRRLAVQKEKGDRRIPVCIFETEETSAN